MIQSKNTMSGPPVKSLIVLLAANLMTLYGVLFLGWSSFEIVFVYCLESILIGIFNIFKMILAGGIVKDVGLKVFLAPFFAFHYNAFMIGQLVFVYL